MMKGYSQSSMSRREQPGRRGREQEVELFHLERHEVIGIGKLFMTLGEPGE